MAGTQLDGTYRRHLNGQDVGVIGFGGIGSGAVQGARLAGAEKIIVVEPVEANPRGVILHDH